MRIPTSPQVLVALGVLRGFLKQWLGWWLKVHPGRLTWNLQITHLERKMIFQTSMIMVHVNLPGCMLKFLLEVLPGSTTKIQGEQAVLGQLKTAELMGFVVLPRYIDII